MTLHRPLRPPVRIRRRRTPRLLVGAVVLGLAAGPVASAPSTFASDDDATVTVEATVETEPGPNDQDSMDDPAIWVHPTDPSRSVVIGTDRRERAIDVYDLSGERIDRLEVSPIGANNVDVRDGFPLGGERVPLVGLGGSGEASFYRLDPDTRKLEDVSGEGYVELSGAHGVCLYHNDTTGRFYAFVVNRYGFVHQYELTGEGGEVAAAEVRVIDVEAEQARDGDDDTLEPCTVDDELGYLYVSEQDYRVWRYGAEPDGSSRVDPSPGIKEMVDETRDLGGHLTDDVEGLAVVARPGGDGFLVFSSQGDDSFTVYRRRPPHDFVRHVRMRDGELADGCDRTDGIEAVAANLGPAFPHGVFVCQDNDNTGPAAGNQNFKYVPLEDVVPLTGAPADPPPAASPPRTAPPTEEPPDDASGDREHPGALPPVGEPADPPARGPAGRSGYWMAGRDGAVFPFGDAADHGGAEETLGGARITDLEPTTDGDGYWLVAADGAVHPRGGAADLGDAVGRLAPGEEVTSLSATPSGAGYRLFTNRGRAMTFGDADHRGDLADVTLNGPVLDSVATPSGDGYFLVAADGGIFAFGDAAFAGSMGATPLNAPVQSLVPDPDAAGYWLVAADGGVFAFDAPFRGSMGDHHLNAPVTGMVAHGRGYLMVAADGGIFNFSDRPFHGSLGSASPPAPIVSVAAFG